MGHQIHRQKKSVYSESEYLNGVKKLKGFMISYDKNMFIDTTYSISRSDHSLEIYHGKKTIAKFCRPLQRKDWKDFKKYCFEQFGILLTVLDIPIAYL